MKDPKISWLTFTLSSTPTPLSKKFYQSTKKSSRVLTRTESRRFLQEKEEKKHEKETHNIQRKKDNEERKRVCSEMKEQKRLEKEQQAAAKKQNPTSKSKPCMWSFN